MAEGRISTRSRVVRELIRTHPTVPHPCGPRRSAPVQNAYKPSAFFICDASSGSGHGPPDNSRVARVRGYHHNRDLYACGNGGEWSWRREPVGQVSCFGRSGIDRGAHHPKIPGAAGGRLAFQGKKVEGTKFTIRSSNHPSWVVLPCLGAAQPRSSAWQAL